MTGLEKITVEELNQNLNLTSQIDSRRGKVFFKLSSLANVHELTKLRSVEHVFSVVHTLESEDVYENTELAEKFFMRLPDRIDWTEGLKSWAAYYDKSGFDVDKLKQKFVLPDDYKPQFTNGRKRKITGVPAFRVTASRTGEREGASPTKGAQVSNDESKKHSFTSDQVAKWFGAAVNNKFGWQPNMKNFDMEIIIYVNDSRILIGLLLTHEALHRRNISAFGHTTLNSTIAFGLGRMCNLKTGDILIDPMCGSGAIPIECCAYRKSDIFGISSEISHNPAEKARTNLEKYPELVGLKRGLSMDVARFDATFLPLKTASVDVVITDLPFGLRVGSKKSNEELYPKVLMEAARIVKPASGRGAFLTQDKRNFIKAITHCKGYWYVANNPHINMGGMTAAIFVLTRTKKQFLQNDFKNLEAEVKEHHVASSVGSNGYEADIASSCITVESSKDNNSQSEEVSSSAGASLVSGEDTVFTAVDEEERKKQNLSFVLDSTSQESVESSYG